MLSIVLEKTPYLTRAVKAIVISGIFTIVCSVVQGLSQAIAEPASNNAVRKCTELLLGQFLCSEPDIDPQTQQARNCDKETEEAFVWCQVAPGVLCDGLFDNGTFQKAMPCQWTNGHSFETALLLSIFLGMFGVDRFYLGYPAIGLVKFATLGFMFLGQLIDILLIATQVVTPSDGSAYVLDYYGASVKRIRENNETYLVPGD